MTFSGFPLQVCVQSNILLNAEMYLKFRFSLSHSLIMEGESHENRASVPSFPAGLWGGHHTYVATDIICDIILGCRHAACLDLCLFTSICQPH